MEILKPRHKIILHSSIHNFFDVVACAEMISPHTTIADLRKQEAIIDDVEVRARRRKAAVEKGISANSFQEYRINL